MSEKEYEYIIEGYMESFEDYRPVKALDAQGAAEEACRHFDKGDYCIARDGYAEVRVREVGTDLVTTLLVSVDFLPHYYARNKP